MRKRHSSYRLGSSTLQLCPLGYVAPATIQRLIREVFVGPGGDEAFCGIFIDNILVLSDIMEQHIEHLRQIFEKLHNFNIYLHPGKCKLALLRVTSVDNSQLGNIAATRVIAMLYNHSLAREI